MDRQLNQYAADALAFRQDQERRAEMEALGVTESRPPLPLSSHLKVKATGEILPWTLFFAECSSECENCDAYGNTDPAAWQGTVPASADFGDVIQKRDQQVAQAMASANREPEVPKMAGMTELGLPETIDFTHDKGRSERAQAPIPAFSDFSSLEELIAHAKTHGM